MSCEEELCKVSLLSLFKLACYIIDSDNVTRETHLIVKKVLRIVLCNIQHMVALVVYRNRKLNDCKQFWGRLGIVQQMNCL